MLIKNKIGYSCKNVKQLAAASSTLIIHSLKMVFFSDFSVCCGVQEVVRRQHHGTSSSSAAAAAKRPTSLNIPYVSRISFWIRNLFHIATHLLLLVVVGRRSSNSLRLCQFTFVFIIINTHLFTESNFIWRHTFKKAAMVIVHAEKCCHLVSAHAASARRPLLHKQRCPPAVH